ncbi:bifunctional PIG-L family deacetylase/class I SAM-dependent methyltransferase [Arthrobacter sulfonylureivorans]|uniref:bifunctional PIG-L family deacetylase/class I SAM-dependent methyltransferase n=1 Tax=Arthrobacter sulfonylureivorans TaxID=2486855 RepID=UPI0030CB97A4
MTFSHIEAGTPEADWQAAGIDRLPALAEGVVPGRGCRLVVAAAHPDDESLGAAGLIHSSLARGADVTVLLCTAGEASHPDSPTYSAADLRRLRLAEFRAAMQALETSAQAQAQAQTQDQAQAQAQAEAQARSGLGASAGRLEWQFLGIPDGMVGQHADALDAAFAKALEGHAHAVVAAPYRQDGHPDHEAVGRAAARSATAHRADLLEFPIWYWHWADPEAQTSWTNWKALPLSAQDAAAKQLALAAHASQTQPLSPAAGDEVLLSEAFQEHFDRGVEVFEWTPAGPAGSEHAEHIFDRLYRGDPDPWNYLSSWYERRKRAVTLAALPAERYGNALEVGCSIGVLTAELAARCDRLMAVDASGVALDQARRRLAEYKNVELVQAQLPAGWPSSAADGLDLVAISEIGYFLKETELRELLRKVQETLNPGGHLLLCHWLHPIDGWELDGEQVHAIAKEATGWDVVALHRERDFLLEVLQAPERAQ